MSDTISIVGTATTFSGTPRQTKALHTSDIVTVANGTRMTVEMAEQLGLITRSPFTGHYRDGGPEIMARHHLTETEENNPL